MLGWCWLALILVVTLPTFWIRELNYGSLSLINLLTVATLVGMAVAVIAISKGQGTGRMPVQ